ncbi:alcohol dehydrogenase groES-like domain-containing protein [Sarocladium implicatum]|nr:alcohol dehydrogenase groES-like domain-containing protein [Sarocladium implicatum]
MAANGHHRPAEGADGFTVSKGKTMRAVLLDSEEKTVSVTDVPFPTIQKPEDAIVRITTTTICGSDLHFLHGSLELPSAHRHRGIGHEAIGIVEKVGAAVDFLQPGDRVVILSFFEDGRVNPKQTMNPLLEDDGRLGYGLTSDEGLQAQYVRVPWADSSLVKVPKKLEDKEWLVLADIWPTAWGALDWSGFEAGDSVAVFGAGPVGLMAAYSAIIRGASLVYVVDHIPQRLAKAAGMGAVPINFTRGGSASQQILRLHPKGVKRVVDCVGGVLALNEELELQEDYVIKEALTVVRGQGGIGIAGVYATESPRNPAPGFENITGNIKLPFGLIQWKEIQIRGGIVRYFDIIPMLMELIGSGRARPGFVFTDEMSLEDSKRAYKRFERKEEVKILLNPGTRDDQHRPLVSRVARD